MTNKEQIGLFTNTSIKSDNFMELNNKVAVVTGAAQGIGKVIAMLLARKGASLVVCDINLDMANETANEIEVAGGKCLALKSDVTSVQDAEKIIKETVEHCGSVDILVNNAGITKDNVLLRMKEEQWDMVIDINLKGYFNYIRAVAPLMREQRYGRIVCLTSINGMRGKFGQANYSATKAGIIGLVKTAAKELGSRGVTVNAIAPGLILTDMMEAMPEEAKQASLDETALKRLGEPEDVAHVVSFFCSDYARHVTGEVIKVDGGQYI